MAATTQIVAALVRPTTAPRAWRIVPAPMKPTPVTICAATRVVSVPAASPPLADSIESERCVYSTEPMQIRMLVRSPAGLPPSSRSRPMAPASNVARPICSISSRRNMSTIWVNMRLSLLPGLEEAHPLTHLHDGTLRERPRTVRARAQPGEHAGRIAPQRLGALADRRQRPDHVVGQHALAVEAPPPRRPALLRHLRDGLGWRKALM